MSFHEPKPRKLSVDPNELDFGNEGVVPASADVEPKRIEQPSQLSPEEQSDILTKVVIKFKEAVHSGERAELTAIEASLVYEVDKDLPESVPGEPDIGLKTLAAAIRYDRGMQDYEQVKSLIKERLTSEYYVINTSRALDWITEGLGVEKLTPADYINTLKEYMADWETREIDADGHNMFDYLTTQLIEHNTRHDIVPVPNPPEGEEFTLEQIVTLARKFSENRPDRTYFVDDSYEPEEQFYPKYSIRDLCGDPTDGPLRLSLAPSRPGPLFNFTTVEMNIKTFRGLQEAAPKLNLHVPPALDTLARLYVLRAGGDSLDGQGTFAKTCVSQFLLTPQYIGDRLYVPNIFIDGNLFMSAVTLDHHYGVSRVSVK